MAYMTRREADEFRRKIESILAYPHPWRGDEDRPEWLWKLLRREDNYYTQREREEVARIVYFRTPIEGWGGYSVSELAKGAWQHCAAVGPDEEQLVKEAEHANRLPRSDMGALVGLCIFAGMDIPSFSSGPNPYRYDDV